MVIDHLSTIETIKDYIDESYEHAIDLREPLPAAVAEPGPLIARVIRLAGPNGITRQRLLDIFHVVGKEQVQRGLDTMLAGGSIQGHIEQRPNAAGREQRQPSIARRRIASRLIWPALWSAGWLTNRLSHAALD